MRRAETNQLALGRAEWTRLKMQATRVLAQVELCCWSAETMKKLLLQLVYDEFMLPVGARLLHCHHSCAVCCWSHCCTTSQQTRWPQHCVSPVLRFRYSCPSLGAHILSQLRFVGLYSLFVCYFSPINFIISRNTILWNAMLPFPASTRSALDGRIVFFLLRFSLFILHFVLFLKL